MASNGKVSNISEALQKAKGPHLWDETFHGPVSRNGTREDRAKCFTKVIFNEENVCHLTAKLRLESYVGCWDLSLEFLSKWQIPSRLSYEINFEAKRESTSTSEDLTIFKKAQENLNIKEWSKCGDSLNMYAFTPKQNGHGYVEYKRFNVKDIFRKTTNFRSSYQTG